MSKKKSLKKETRLVDLGLDSLMVTEIRQLIERDYSMTFTADEVQYDLHN